MIDTYYIAVLIIAGLLAGVVTGLVSASASCVMTPILTIVLKIDVYTALGISLATDVVASLATTYIYGKHKCVAYKKSLLLICSATIFSIIGSFLSKDSSNFLLGTLSAIGIFALALQFLKGDFTARFKKFNEIKLVKFLLRTPNLFVMFAGIAIGLNTGIMGAGGGVLILFTLMLGYKMDMKTAIGTSAFVMSVIAFCGGSMHFYYGRFELFDIAVTALSAFAGAVIASAFVHKVSEKILSRAAGLVFFCISIVMLGNQFTNFSF